MAVAGAARSTLYGSSGYGKFTKLSVWNPTLPVDLHTIDRDDAEATQLPLKTETPRWKPALARWIDPKRLGAALLITCACDDIEEKYDEQKTDPLYENSDLLVPGGVYREESKVEYRRQALLGVDLIADALERIGVPSARIFHNDFTSGDASAPKEAVQSLIRRMPQHLPDVLVYYVGNSIADGAWALGWMDYTMVDGEEKEDLVTTFLEPEDLNPPVGDGDGPPGFRFVVADAPETARMWLRPATRLVGLAAWSGGGKPGGNSGPPLARWLAGFTAKPPDGVVSFDLPPDVELRKLPSYMPLFWGPTLDAQRAGRLLWELQEFVGSPTRFEVQKQVCYEILARGGPQLLMSLLFIHVRAAEELLLQIIWLLHHLVLHAPLERWIGTMEEALADVLNVPKGRASPSQALLAAVLGFAAATASRCPVCRGHCSGGSWPQVLALALQALNGERHVGAVAAASRAVAQVASSRVLEMTEHRELLDALVHALLASYGSTASTAEARQAAAEALLFMSMRCNEAKKRGLEVLGRSGKLPSILEKSSPLLVAKILSLLRSLAAVEPSDKVKENLDPEVLDCVIHCLCTHVTDTGVQRWGLAALGALAAADEKLAGRGAEAGATCVIWALGADELGNAPAVEQEAMFCAHALCSTATGRAQLASPDAHIPGLIAGAVARTSLSSPANAEGAVWGLRFFERLARSKDTLPMAEPYISVIIDAIRAPGCKVNAAAAGAGALSLLANGSTTAHESILPHAGQVVKALTALARRAAAADGNGELGRRREKDLNDWARVIVHTLGEPEDRTYDRMLEEEVLTKEELDREGGFSGYNSRRGSVKSGQGEGAAS